MADKVLTLHPTKETGQLDIETNIYPITKESCVLDNSGNPISNGIQPKLISGINIKTINGSSILGSGNIDAINMAESVVKNILKTYIFPVGAIYVADSNFDGSTCPIESYLTDTYWEPIENTFLYAASESVPVGSVGGSNDASVIEHNHQFTGTRSNTENAGSHYHQILGTTEGVGHITDVVCDRVVLNADKNIIETNNSGTHSHYFTPSGTISTVGVSGTKKNMPKYKAVWIWRRVA